MATTRIVRDLGIVTCQCRFQSRYVSCCRRTGTELVIRIRFADLAMMTITTTKDRPASGSHSLTMSTVADYATVHVDDFIVDSDLLHSAPPPRSLRVCCYGSSSSLTPEQYLQEARHVGYLLAKRGHVTVNGAGSYGCMAAMNDGACKGKL